MDHKTWLWRKKSSEKTIFASEKVQRNPTGKGVGSERSGKALNEKLASVLLDCHVKEDLVTEDTKISEQNITGQERTEEETEVLKQELDQALRQGVATNERLTHSDAALRECKQRLNIVQEEQERKIRDAVMMASREHEKAQKNLQTKFTEASKQLSDLTVENSNLTKAILVKEKAIEELNRRKSQADAEFSALMTRLDSTEKENAFLKYEFHMLEKELQIRNEEMEYYRQSADASQKQQFECVKKITMLEQECRRLRLSTRKRLPGPPNSLARNIKSEVQVKGRNQTDMRSRKLNPTKDLIVRDAAMENFPETLSKDLNFLFDRLRAVEEENEAFKRILNTKSPELHSSKALYAQAASRLLGADMQLMEHSKGQKSMELLRSSPQARKLSMSLDFDAGSDDAISSSGSWANALISELEHFKSGKLKDLQNRKAFEVSDISLMDDFVEMEKLAIVSADTPSRNGYPDLPHKDLVPVSEVLSSFSDRKREQLKDTDKSFDWLQVVLNAMLEQKRVSNRSLEELVEDIKIAIAYFSFPITHEADKTAKSWTPAEADPHHISGYLTWNSPKGSPILNSLSGAPSVNTSLEVSSDQNFQCGLSKSICKIIKLIQVSNPGSLAGNYSPDSQSEKDQKFKPSATSADYFIRVFQWQRSELNAILQRFIRTCNDLLNGKANLESFADEVASALDWILNNYVTPKEAASTRDKIKKHFGWDEAQSGDDQRACLPSAELDLVQSERQSLGWPLVGFKEGQDALIQLDKVQCTLQEENSKLKNELKSIISAKTEMEASLNSAKEKSEALVIQLQESEQRIRSLQAELETVKETKGTIEDEIENEKLINEDLDTQLTVARARLNEVFQKVSSLEVELEDKRNFCEELEATCLELQLQLESDATKENPKHKINQEEKQSQTGWEISTASAKLAECQETIVNLGKQLKALASPREAALLDKVFSTTSATSIATKDKLNKHSSLRDRMLAEDDAKAEIVNSKKVNETTTNADADQKPSLSLSNGQNTIDSPNVPVHTPLACRSSSSKTSNNAAGALAIVPSKKKGGFDLLRKLLLRRKKGNSQKSRFLANV